MGPYILYSTCLGDLDDKAGNVANKRSIPGLRMKKESCCETLQRDNEFEDDVFARIPLVTQFKG